MALLTLSLPYNVLFASLSSPVDSKLKRTQADQVMGQVSWPHHQPYTEPSLAKAILSSVNIFLLSLRREYFPAILTTALPHPLLHGSVELSGIPGVAEVDPVHCAQPYIAALRNHACPTPKVWSETVAVKKLLRRVNVTTHLAFLRTLGLY